MNIVTIFRTQHPYFGFVKRSVNRAPSRGDTWWQRHSDTCGGTFVKIRSPDKQNRPVNKKDKGTKPHPSTDIRLFFKTDTNKLELSLPDNRSSQLECIDITQSPPHSPTDTIHTS